MTASACAPIGIVGLGLVGNAIARRLALAGHPTIGFDLREEARAAFAAGGGTVAPTLSEMAKDVRVAVLAVFSTADVLEVIEGPHGLLSRDNLVAVIDCSTGTPDLLEALAARLADRGVAFIEAPLSGSSEQIAAGEATMLLGGSEQVIGHHARLLDAIAAQRIRIGGAGMGARAKLATNLVLGLNRAALAEGFVFAESLGIAPEAFLSLVMATPARSGAAESKGRMMVSGDFRPQSRIRQHLKDVDLMLDGARRAGQPLPLSEAHAALMRAAVAAGDGELDNAALIRQLRRQRVPPPDL